MAQSNFKIVLVTAPDMKTARGLVRIALGARLIACANLVPGIESHYHWQGRVERSAEVLLVLKTSQARLAALEKLVLAKHPYDTPEFVVLNPVGGTKKVFGVVERVFAGVGWIVTDVGRFHLGV